MVRPSYTLHLPFTTHTLPKCFFYCNTYHVLGPSFIELIFFKLPYPQVESAVGEGACKVSGNLDGTASGQPQHQPLDQEKSLANCNDTETAPVSNRQLTFLRQQQQNCSISDIGDVEHEKAAEGCTEAE